MNGRSPAQEVAPQRTGRSAHGMDYVVLGDGPASILSIPGGPGSEVPTGAFGRMILGLNKTYLDAGYSVWHVTRPRNMPAGHTVEDMAADYAQFVRDELGGQVDLVVGQSYGGMIALYLAANHPDVARYVVVAVASAEITASGTDLDVQWATARAEGRTADAGAAFLEYVVAGPRWAWLRRLGGPLVGRLFDHSATPIGDLLVEARAEAAYDARAVLGRIDVPVLMVCGDADRFFSVESVEQTAAAIRDCTLLWYRGRGHLRAASSKQLPRDVLTWVASRESLRRALQMQTEPAKGDDES